MSTQMKAEKGTVKIRMYRQGLGDCFLLAFNGDDGNPRYMLIDCGVIQGTPDDSNKMIEVAESIKEATNAHIHVLAITHEHWDHICGFAKAEKVFKEFEIDQVWFGWTEDPDDKNAAALKEKKNSFLKALHLAVGKIKETNLGFADKLEGLLEFHGDLSAASDKGTSASIMEMLKERAKPGKPFYLHPGQIQKVPGVPGIRVFVMGPPESKEMIERSSPRKGEVYLSALESGFFDAFKEEIFRKLDPGMKASAESDTAAAIQKNPFDQSYMIDPNGEKSQPMEAPSYKYWNENQWQRIDDLWLEASEELALNLDSDTNNTSLVLAIELTGSGKVLLFPGDAQVGNWLSWEGLSWQVKGKNITSRELLGRTVLYKVGHHGSHNATLREKGLELMTNPGLTAMIPVEAEMAKKKRWKMPFEPLYDRLYDMSKGRIIRVDEGVTAEKPADVSQVTWDSFKEQVTETPLYCEYTIK